MKTGLAAIVMLVSSTSGALAAGNFLPFEEEAKAVHESTLCPSPKLDLVQSDWTCFFDPMQELVFLSIQAEGANVSSVTLSWDDYFKDVGQGWHASAPFAERAIKMLGKLYGFGKPDDLARVFQMTVENRTFSSDGFELAISIEQGPAIITRTLTITSK